MKTRPQQVYTWHGGMTPIPTRRPDFDCRIIAELLHQEFGGVTRRWMRAYEAGENPAPPLVPDAKDNRSIVSKQKLTPR